MTEYPLGRLVNHDPRSRSFGVMQGAAAEPLPLKSRLWRTYGATLDQLDTNSCTGHAMAHWLNSQTLNAATQRAYKPAYPPLQTHGSAMGIYARATEIDPFPWTYPPTDEGSSGLAVAKAAQEKGYISRYEWAFGFDQALQAAMRGPLLVGTNWYDSMWTTIDGVVSILPSARAVGGHEYLLTGVDTRKKMVRFRNSWGPGWGDNGSFWMSYETFDRLLDEDGDVILPIR